MADTFRTEITADRAQYDATMDGMAQKALTSSQAAASAIRASFLNIDQNQMVAGFNASFDVIKKGAESVRGVLAGIAAVAAAAAGFVKLADDSEKATLQVEVLARTLGVTTQEASALKIALNDIGVGTDDYTTMVGKLTVKLRDNEERFNQLGVVTRGANGELLDTREIVQNSLAALTDFTIGTDRNLASTELFSRGWADVVKLMRLTPEAMEQARTKAAELQLVIGPEGVERAHAYQAAMSDVKDMLEGIWNRIGTALMPVLTDMGNWFATLGPAAILLTRGAFGGLIAVIQGFMLGVRIAFDVAASTIYSIVEPLAAVAQAVALAISGDFEGAGRRLSQIPANVSANWKRNLDEIAERAAKTKKDLIALFDPNAEQGESQPGAKGKTYEAPGKERVAKWDAELAAQRDAYDKMKLGQNSFEQFTFAMEAAYWKNILDTENLSSIERAAVSKKYYDAERNLRKQAFDAQIADLKQQAAMNQTNAEQRIELASKVYQLEVQRHGASSKEAIAALQDVQKATDTWSKQQQELLDLRRNAERDYQLSRVALERSSLETMEQLGVIKTAKKLDALKRLKEIEYQIELKALEDKLELMAQDPSLDPVKYQEQLNAIKALKQKHTADMASIDNQMALDAKKTLDTWFGPAGNAFQKFVDGVISGTRKWTDVVRGALVSMAQEYAATFVKIGLNWVKTELLKTNATVASVTARTTAETAGASESILVTAGAAVANITAKAFEAAGSVYASIAAIPVVGPFLAPAMAVAAAATVLGFIGHIAHAAGGFDVPAGMNPMTQLHQEEMVLPADIANPLRASLAAGGGMGGEVHLHVHTQSVKDFKRFLMENRHAVADALRASTRDFH